MSTMAIAERTGVLLHGVSWQTYVQLREEPANAGLRLTYADGDLEVMTPSHRHERWHYLLGRAIQAMTDELGIQIHGGAATTLRCQRSEVGLEPDQCYWVQHEPDVRGKIDLDTAVDPLPDLCIESEASRYAIDKLRLFGSLGVPEVWRYDGDQLTVHVIGDGGAYTTASSSLCFPWLPLTEFSARLATARTTAETTWVRALRAWVRGPLPAQN